MKIKIDEIQKITFLLFSKLKENKGDEIEIANDYYWDISNDELYNPYEEPKNITLGQLSDDIKEIQRLANPDDAIIYDLKRLAVILKAISVENQTAF
jgi:hypothetical protein